MHAGELVDLDVPVDAAGDDDVLFRTQSHALDRVVVGFEEVDLKKI
jgi:hypothetical protein